MNESLDLLSFKRNFQLFFIVYTWTVLEFRKSYIDDNCNCSQMNQFKMNVQHTQLLSMDLEKFQWNHYWICCNVIPRLKWKKLIRSKKNLVFLPTLRWAKHRFLFYIGWTINIASNTFIFRSVIIFPILLKCAFIFHE